MPAKFATILPPTATGYATAHDHPNGSEVFMLYTQATCPEMRHAEMSRAAEMHANQLIADGGVWADQVRVYLLLSTGGKIAYTARTACDVCGEFTWHQPSAKFGHCHNPSHVSPGHYHEFPTDGTTACPKCHQYNGKVSSVYVSAFDTYQTMCDTCRTADARQTAWLYSGMAAKTRRAQPPDLFGR